MKKALLPAMLTLVALLETNVQADVPKISNLRFSDNPVTLGEYFTLSFAFEGSADRCFVENSWETEDGQAKNR